MRAKFLIFAAVGLIGFVCDAGPLYLLIHMGFGPYVGRVISFAVAVAVTWSLNRRLTFARTAKAHPAREFAKYAAAMCCAGAVNYAVYCGTLWLVANSSQAPILGVALGSFAGLFVNFTLARFWVYKSSDV